MYPERSPHDLSHLSFQAGAIGRLQTITQIPVLPGDGAQIDITGAIRLSPLRRGLAVDSRVDMCAFYIPYRHIYGDNWVDFIEQGYDETVDLATATVNTGFWGGGYMSAYGFPLSDGQEIPLWLSEGYKQIWNRYYRPPTTIPEFTSNLWDNEENAKFGLRCAHLKRMWTTGVNNALSAQDTDIDTSSGSFSLLDLAAQKGYLKTELEREFFNVRYADIVNEFGGSTNFSADDRPTLIMQRKFWASGYDVDGTSETNLGQFSGRVTQAFNFKMPRWHVPEHGTIWVMALVRFPPTHHNEQMYLVNKPNPTYAQISGDPDIYATQTPLELQSDDVFDQGNTDSLGYVPYGQWYRYHPDYVHQNYRELQGFPFLNDSIPGPDNRQWLVNSSDYDDMFQTTQLEHWNLQARVNATFMRRLPTARDSIVAGTKG